MLAVNLGEKTSPVQRFKQEYEVSFPILMDPLIHIGSLYGVRGTPTHFLIDRQGKVIAGGAGIKDWSGEEAQELIKQLLEAR